MSSQIRLNRLCVHSFSERPEFPHAVNSMMKPEDTHAGMQEEQESSEKESADCRLSFFASESKTRRV